MPQSARSTAKLKHDWKLSLINGDVFVSHITRNGSALFKALAAKRMKELYALPEPSTEQEIKKNDLQWQGLFSIVNAGVHVEHMGKHAARAADVRQLVERICALPLPTNKTQQQRLKDNLDEARMEIQTLAYEGLAQRRMRMWR